MDFVGVTGGGTDVIPNAIDLANIVVTAPNGGYESNLASQVTFAGIDTSIVVRAKWTSTSSHPATAQWIKSGVAVQTVSASPIDVNISNGDMLYMGMFAGGTFPSGNYDTGTVRVTNESRTAAVTMTIASPAVVTWVAHGFSAGDKVLFRTTGALPTGIVAETVYFVIAAGLGADVFEVSATSGGAAIDTSGTQSGTHTGVSVLDTFSFAVQFVNSGSGGGGIDPSDNVPHGGEGQAH